MRTSKPIATISYNTEEFLRKKIEYWKSSGIIEFGMWIRHDPEQDEKKAHWHVFIKPAQLIQTMDLETDSMEIDPNCPEKPLKMIGFRPSKESDWVLYGIHDPTYLVEKGLEREIVYSLEDIQSTCDDTLKDIIAHISDERNGKLEYRIIQCINKGLSWQEIVSSGLVPLRYMAGAKIMYQAITGDRTI